MILAADHTAHTISVTRENGTDSWYGVDFEETMPDLIRALEKKHK